MIKQLVKSFHIRSQKYFQPFIYVLTILFFIIMCSIFAWYSYLNHITIPACKKHLWQMATKRTDEIAQFLQEQETNAITLSEKPILIDALYAIYAQKKSNGIQTDEKKITDLLASYKDQMFFKQIMLIDVDGNIIFSTKHDIIGKNINKQDPHSSLSTSCERATMTFTNDFSYFTFDQLLQEPAVFITIPILKDNRFIGTLSYQLNQEKIYLITNQYIGLGKTGEVLLGKREDSYVVFVAPSRHDPDLAFKKISVHNDIKPSLHAALITRQGTDIAQDYRGKSTIIASTFIPKLDWGLAVKIDQEEIVYPVESAYKLFLIFFAIFLLFFLLSLFYIRHKIVEIIHSNSWYKRLQKAPAIVKNPFFICTLLFLGFAIKNIVQEEQIKLSMIQAAKNKAIKTISRNVETIETMLSKIAFVADAIAEDLHTQHLQRDDIMTRLKRDLKENSSIVGITILFMPYTYDSSTQLYAPSIVKNDSTYQNTSRTEKSLDKEQEASIFKAAWYTNAMEHGSAWLLNPLSQNSHRSAATATYSCKFLDHNNQPNGVVLLTYSLSDIIQVAEFSNFGQTGYSIILSENGTFIFHPIHQLIKTQTTLLQFAQSKGNEELAIIAKKALEKKSILESYSAESGNDTFTIYTHPIAINNWVLGAIFSDNEVGLSSQTIRHYYFWTLIWFTLFLIMLSVFLYSFSVFGIMHCAVFANIILILSLILSWYIIKITTTINRESKTVITDQSSLNKFLNDLDEEAHRKHENPPIKIPFGLYLYSLDIPDADHIAISGYIWSKYNGIVHKNISHTIEMPQATKIQFGTPLTTEIDEWETVTVNVQGTLFQEQDYAQYPFDQQQIRIIFEHRNIEKNIILTPDLASYKKLSPEATPGLDKEFSLSGFSIEQSFFEYHKIDPTTNFGFQDYGKVTDHFQLIYNVIMNRNLLNPFVLYLLPLLVILFSLFCTLLMTEKRTDPFSVLAPYTGLFFALVILQRALREQHPTGTTLYMEYAFFYTYVTIILLIIHTILTHYYTHWSYYQDKALRTIKLLFWPFQFVAWLITTLIIFY